MFNPIHTGAIPVADPNFLVGILGGRHLGQICDDSKTIAAFNEGVYMCDTNAATSGLRLNLGGLHIEDKAAVTKNLLQS